MKGETETPTRLANMNNYKSGEKEKLNGFRNYLLEVAELSESTSNDYCKRLMTICAEEGIEITDLSENIEKLCYEYTEGPKKDKGARSHNSYRSSIINFKNYINWAQSQQTTKNDKKYLVHMCNSKVSNSLVGVAEMINTSTNQILCYRPYTKEEMKTGSSKMVLRMVWEMAFDVIVKDKSLNEIASILSSLDFGLEIEDETSKAFKRFF